MDTRTILNVRPDPEHDGHTLMDLSDGSTVIFGDWIAEGANIRAEIRNADGSLSGDGPILDDGARAKFEANGVQNIPVPTAPITVAKEVSAAPADAAPPTPAAPALALTEAERAHSKSLADKIEGFFANIPAEARSAWNELRALLRHV